MGRAGRISPTGLCSRIAGCMGDQRCIWVGPGEAIQESYSTTLTWLILSCLKVGIVGSHLINGTFSLSLSRTQLFGSSQQIEGRHISTRCDPLLV
ncbi:hypothetical protein AXF42_Ash008525 [Apostasia shenzhenica]|uniref:Uncharacterized protein n=1 Tax=Apostasia shenzhenica TaxID=1088818 RepID=A0A2I0B1M0_9ASPA|nr:hypothetical protein AXF42_Ash008525 [Apostasia shenzhenica]